MVQRKFGFPEAVLTGQRKATERESFRSVLDMMKSFTGLYVMMGEDIGTHILPPMPPRPLTQAKGNQEKAKEEDKKAGVEEAGSYDESEGVDESEGTEESEGMEEAGAYEGIEEARDMECVEQTGPGEDVGRVEEEDEEMDDEESEYDSDEDSIDEMLLEEIEDNLKMMELRAQGLIPEEAGAY